MCLSPSMLLAQQAGAHPVPGTWCPAHGREALLSLSSLPKSRASRLCCCMGLAQTDCCVRQFACLALFAALFPAFRTVPGTQEVW